MARESVIDMQYLLECISSGESIGFCLACGEEAFGVEPDAENYTCEDCGKPRVMGAEQILISGSF